jgi:membrane-associated phospholipid phosphatase
MARQRITSETTVMDDRRHLAPAIALAVLLPVTLALTLVAAGPGVLPGDVTIALWLQALPLPDASGIARLGYWAGSGVVAISINVLLMVLLWWSGRPRLTAIAVGILLLRSLNPLLKLLLISPRPALDQVVVTELASGYGFPSGHVNSAMLTYGGIIWVAEHAIEQVWLRRAVQIVAALLILITAFGRVYTGAHWPSDVLGGFLWGLTELVFLAVIVDRFLPRFLPDRQPDPLGSGGAHPARAGTECKHGG